MSEGRKLRELISRKPEIPMWSHSANMWIYKGEQIIDGAIADHRWLQDLSRWADEVEALAEAALRAETPAPREILNDAIQCAARDLPERWRIEIVVEKGSGWANIYDPKDDCLPDSVTGVSPDFDLEEQVRYLTKWAAGEPEQAK